MLNQVRRVIEVLHLKRVTVPREVYQAWVNFHFIKNAGVG